MESISVFDILKIGVGPSSSHTMGPWRAAEAFVADLRRANRLSRVVSVHCDLFGSLAKTGIGHGTDVAVMLGLSGEDPVTCETTGLHDRIDAIKTGQRLRLGGERGVDFDYHRDIAFNKLVTLPEHPNGLTLRATLDDRSSFEQTFFSVGGGFITMRGQDAPPAAQQVRLPFPVDTGDQLLAHCRRKDMTIPQVVLANELAWRSEADVRAGVVKIWRTMLECIHRGCHTPGTLPGGLEVTRRAMTMNEGLLGESTPRDPAAATFATATSPEAWRSAVRACRRDFQFMIKWVSCFALAVNEENAAFGRVVTAPTNGAAGVIPAVLCYYEFFCEHLPMHQRLEGRGVVEFLLTASVVGALFKKGATISAAMGGCQAEIGVSSAMAAAGLAQCMGASPGQVLMAAEIAMEHHLGMTCDPIAGLVQIPCIERNTMGAIKAITAANIAIDSDPAKAKVSLDGVIRTMWETALDMKDKYKETAEGGLAVHVSVNIAEC
jgi:L-serine dehydratase